MPYERPTFFDHLYEQVGLRFSDVQLPARLISKEGGGNTEEKGGYRWPSIFC